MGDDYTVYICDQCKKTSRVRNEDPVPMCCGKLMTRLTLSGSDTVEKEPCD